MKGMKAEIRAVRWDHGDRELHLEIMVPTVTDGEADAILLHPTIPAGSRSAAMLVQALGTHLHPDL